MTSKKPPSLAGGRKPDEVQEGKSHGAAWFSFVQDEVLMQSHRRLPNGCAGQPGENIYNIYNMSS
jgi:hypothetical protein